MAAKKKAKTGAKALAPTGTADTELVQDAYEDSLKQLVQTYFTNCILTSPKDAEITFLVGLPIIRNARERALQLVQVEPTSK